MKLTEQQILFFNDFGYLLLPKLLQELISAIIEEFDRLMAEHISINPHDHVRRTMKWQFIDSSKFLSTLIEDPLINEPLKSLLGNDFLYTGSSGNFFSGSTTWHSDDYLAQKRVKALFYLDPLTSTTGALRVIPHSHEHSESSRNFHEAVSSCDKSYGVHGSDLPSISLDVSPGDVIFFNQNLLHSSWGGGTQRRLFSINVHENYTQDKIPSLLDHIKDLARFGLPCMYGSEMLNNPPAARLVHLQQGLEHQKPLIEWSKEYLAINKVASRDFDITENVQQLQSQNMM